MKKAVKKVQGDYERGRIEEVVLKKPFTLNGNRITRAIIEIDHINFGLNVKTYKLNAKRRSNFSIADVEKFLSLLDGEYIAFSRLKGRKLRFELRMNSPIIGTHYGREYILVFETNYDKQNLIHTITLFRIGK